MTPKMMGRMIISLLFGVIVISALGLFADLSHVGTVLQRFDWGYMPAILGLTLCNYVLRFGKFHFYLRRLAVRLPVVDSAIIFVCGLSMAITPGKVGEMLKPILIRGRTGRPITMTAPVILAERLTDGIAMLLLASSGLFLYTASRPVLVLVAGATIALILIVHNRSLSLALLDRMGCIKRLTGQAIRMRRLYESSYRLLQWGALVPAIAIGVVSWSGECVAFWLVLIGLGQHATLLLLIQATFVLGISSLVGSASLLPGGLGVADGSVAGLLIVLLHIGRAQAVAATLLIRFCTLWFGVSLGIVFLLAFRQRLAPADVAPEPQHIAS